MGAKRKSMLLIKISWTIAFGMFVKDLRGCHLETFLFLFYFFADGQVCYVVFMSFEWANSIRGGFFMCDKANCVAYFHVVYGLWYALANDSVNMFQASN